MNVKPSIGFLTRDGQAPFTEKVATILQWITGNPNYPSPTPALAVVQTAFDAYKVASADAAQGGTENIAIRDARRAELTSLLRQLASYVNATANGNLEKLINSGFPVQKPSRTPIGPLTAPATPAIAQGPTSGTLHATIAPIYGAATYNWRVALQSAPAVDVQTGQTTGGRTIFSGLTPGQIYLISANAVGAAGVSDWSDTGRLMVI